MLASRDGLGQSILLASRSFRSADLFAGIVILGAIGLVGSRFLSLAEARLLRWQATR
jgi:sulfonate transport system permease protein